MRHLNIYKTEMVNQQNQRRPSPCRNTVSKWNSITRFPRNERRIYDRRCGNRCHWFHWCGGELEFHFYFLLSLFSSIYGRRSCLGDTDSLRCDEIRNQVHPYVSLRDVTYPTPNYDKSVVTVIGCLTFDKMRPQTTQSMQINLLVAVIPLRNWGKLRHVSLTHASLSPPIPMTFGYLSIRKR